MLSLSYICKYTHICVKCVVDFFCGKRGVGLYWRPTSCRTLHSVRDQIQSLQNFKTAPQDKSLGWEVQLLRRRDFAMPSIRAYPSTPPSINFRLNTRKSFLNVNIDNTDKDVRHFM